jgi:ribosomal-protein-alanine acetyltransferase
VLIRPAAEQDLTAILEIQSAAPEAAQWNPADYLRYECLVAEKEGLVVGFSVARQVADGEWEILNLAVATAFRRQSVGRRLLGHLLERYRGEIFLEVRESNAAARHLYEQAGFRTITKRLQYYSNPVESGIVMHLYS